MSDISREKTILIMAGGTGGHIFPALAIAKELRKHDVKLSWLGSTRGMENTLVPKHNIELNVVNAVGLRGKGFKSLLKAPFLLTSALFQTMGVFKKVKPDIVLGMGGFASGIGGVVAWLLGIPLVIHEQNAVAGSTNKILAKISKKTFQAFNHSFKASVAVTTSGNPCLFEPKHAPNNNKKINLLVIGGSLGAKPINDVVTQLNIKANIWHQTGKLHHQQVSLQHKKRSVRVDAFIEDMAKAYAWADVVLCRAGAMTISELMLSGKASILIPLPHAIDNHQFYNAKILANRDAGILIKQSDFNVESVEKLINSLDKNQLKIMGENAKKLARPDAAKIITDYLLNGVDAY